MKLTLARDGVDVDVAPPEAHAAMGAPLCARLTLEM